MKTIGVTGISGAGKTTVSDQICKIKNAKHINADKIAKRLWLDDLNSLVLTDDLIKKYNYQKEAYNVEAIIGEYDAPQKQEQGLLTLNFKDTGNVAILGNDSEEVELLI